MIKLLNIIIVLLAAALIAVILYPQIQENRPLPLRLACDSSITSLPFLVAVEETLFTKNRLDPELRFYSDPDSALADLFAGKTDVGIFPWSSVLKRMATHKETLRVFMSIEFRPALPVDAIACRKNARIKQLTDLKGKSLAYPPQFRDYVVPLLAAVNLTPAQVKASEVPFSAIPGLLAAGTVDAAWLLEPQLCPLDVASYDTISGATTRYVSGPFPGAAVGFSPQFLRTTSKTVRMRLKIATDAAVAHIEGKPDKARQTLGRYFTYCTDRCDDCRLPQIHRLVEINKESVKALAARLLAAGVLADTLQTQGIYVEPAQMAR
uniref:ABC transporter substrate-binding protein n=1 Tax=candidate division WOR-3 bacterium TaxID=2052148 RepID=A0A7C4GDH4_UNCW3